MQAILRGKGLWRLVSEKEKCHNLDANMQEEWDNKADKACGILMLGVKQLQWIHFQSVKDNPIEIWKALEPAHVHK